jgi:hypothetical protein
MLELSFLGSSCPVMTAKEEEIPLRVRGMPAHSGTATAELTPGTISHSMPC